jgi:hypothetical protein
MQEWNFRRISNQLMLCGAKFTLEGSALPYTEEGNRSESANVDGDDVSLLQPSLLELYFIIYYQWLCSPMLQLSYV